jgi:hypothetical protein
VTRRAQHLTGLVGVALLVVLAAVACGRRQAEPAAASVPATESAGPLATSTHPSEPLDTPDPIASELDQIQQLIEDIDGSLSEADSGEE